MAPFFVAVLTLFGASIGIVASFIGTAIQGSLGRRADRKRHIRELAVQAAIAHWQAKREDAKRIVDHSSTDANTVISIYPLDLYLIHASLLVDVLDGSITESNIASKLERIERIHRAGAKQVDKYSQTLK